jgi:hypothetical protein
VLVLAQLDHPLSLPTIEVVVGIVQFLSGFVVPVAGSAVGVVLVVEAKPIVGMDAVR